MSSSQSVLVAGTFWVGPFNTRHGTRAVYRVVTVAPYSNGALGTVSMVYAERLDDGAKALKGGVRKVSSVGHFATHHRQVTENEAKELAGA